MHEFHRDRSEAIAIKCVSAVATIFDAIAIYFDAIAIIFDFRQECAKTTADEDGLIG